MRIRMRMRMKDLRGNNNQADAHAKLDRSADHSHHLSADILFLS